MERFVSCPAGITAQHPSTKILVQRQAHTALQTFSRMTRHVTDGANNNHNCALQQMLGVYGTNNSSTARLRPLFYMVSGHMMPKKRVQASKAAIGILHNKNLVPSKKRDQLAHL